MRKLQISLTALTLGLALVGCGTTPPPTAQVASTTAVTLRVPFASAAIQLLGTPATGQRAVVKVYEGDRLETTLNVESYNPYRTVNLKADTSYRFETSVQDFSGQEVAWGARSYTVSRATETIDLKFASILADATLSSAPIRNGTVDIGLQVSGLPSPTAPGQGPSAFSIPLADFEVTYEVTGGTLDHSSKLGARITPAGPGVVTVVAKVSGLDTQHALTTLERKLTFTPLPADTTTVSGRVQNWLTDRQVVANIRASSTSEVAAVGAVDAKGALQLSLPDSAFATEEDFKTLFREISWDTAPVTAHSLTVYGFDLQADDKNIGRLEPGTRVTNGQYTVGDKIGLSLVYVDRDVTGKGRSQSTVYDYTNGNYGPVEVINEFDLVLKKGWNILIKEAKAVKTVQQNYGYPSPNPNSIITQGTVTASALKSGTELPQQLEWQANFANITDLALEQSVDNATPLGSNRVAHTLKITNNGPTEMNVYGSSNFVTVVLPQGVSYDYGSAANCSTSSYSGTETTLRCYFATPQIGKTTVLSFGTSSQEQRALTVKAQVETQSFYDLDKTNDSSSVTITSRAAGGTGAPRIDLQAPQVSFQTVGPLQTGSRVVLKGSANDNSSVAKVELYEGVRLLGTATVTGTTWTYDWTPDKAGTFVLRAIAYDGSGNTGTAMSTVLVN